MFDRRSQAAKQVVLADKPVISDDSNSLEPLQLNQLLAQMATLSSVYFRAPETFVSRTRLAVTRAEELETHKFEESSEGSAATSTSAAAGPASTAVDLLGGDVSYTAPANAAPAANARPAAAAASAGAWTASYLPIAGAGVLLMCKSDV